MTKARVRIAMGQMLVEGGEPERNLRRAKGMIREAKENGAQIVLLPECLDLAWTHPSARTEAQPIPGPHSLEICGTAKEHSIHVCAGLVERAGDKIYNSAIFVNDEGQILLKYRKINILAVAKDLYSVGRSLSVIETSFGLIGVNICSDNYHDALEIGHTLGRMGAQLILSPSSWTVLYGLTEVDNPYGAKWFQPYHTLARLYDLVVVSATSVGVIVGGPYEGMKMVGCSLAVGKDGIIAQGKYNEFAGEIYYADVQIPEPIPLGTAIGERLKALGYYK
jgi:predicted amidohydrolase